MCNGHLKGGLDLKLTELFCTFGVAAKQDPLWDCEQVFYGRINAERLVYAYRRHVLCMMAAIPCRARKPVFTQLCCNVTEPAKRIFCAMVLTALKNRKYRPACSLVAC